MKQTIIPEKYANYFGIIISEQMEYYSDIMTLKYNNIFIIFIFIMINNQSFYLLVQIK